MFQRHKNYGNSKCLKMLITETYLAAVPVFKLLGGGCLGPKGIGFLDIIEGMGNGILPGILLGIIAAFI